MLATAAIAYTHPTIIDQTRTHISNIGSLRLPSVLSEEATDSKKGRKKKSEDVYAPDRPIPQDQHGRPIPESDEPHTQLGTKQGRKGKYPQGREFGEKGKRVKDIDFTDHGRPHDHTNPHQHRREENQTGGTPSREDAEPLPGWIY